MSVVTDPQALAGIALFGGLTLEQLSRLSTLLHRKTFPAGANLITAGQPGEVIYIIFEGSVKIHLEQEDGSDVILAILAAGEIVGEMSLVDCANRCASVVTQEPSTLFWMDRATFQECLQTMPAIYQNLLRLLCDRLRLANERIQSLARRDVEGRVARQVLAFAQLYGQPLAGGDILIPFRLTQSDIASLVGATRERVNQVVASYKQRKYLSVDQNYRITIHNREALIRRASSSHRLGS
jgi:CRP/FNR family cyclic AMP-dependent transcriptional regulator